MTKMASARPAAQIVLIALAIVLLGFNVGLIQSRVYPQKDGKVIVTREGITGREYVFPESESKLRHNVGYDREYRPIGCEDDRWEHCCSIGQYAILEEMAGFNTSNTVRCKGFNRRCCLDFERRALERSDGRGDVLIAVTQCFTELINNIMNLKLELPATCCNLPLMKDLPICIKQRKQVNTDQQSTGLMLVE